MNFWTSVCFIHMAPAAVYSSNNKRADNPGLAAKGKKKRFAQIPVRAWTVDFFMTECPFSHLYLTLHVQRSKMAKDSSLNFSLLLNPEKEKKKRKMFSKVPFSYGGANPGRHSNMSHGARGCGKWFFHTSYLLSREYISRKGRKTRDSGFVFGVAFFIFFHRSYYPALPSSSIFREIRVGSFG